MMNYRDHDREYWEGFCSDKVPPKYAAEVQEGLKEYWRWITTKEQAERFCLSLSDELQGIRKKPVPY